MYQNYFKQVVRKLMQGKIYAFINIIGLTVAITAALLIYSHVAKEFKTDQFHENRENIYRITTAMFNNTTWSHYCKTVISPEVQSVIPGIHEYVRIEPEKIDIKTDEKGAYTPGNACIKTDPQFFSVFNFPLVAGTIGRQDEPWVVISEKAAEHYFRNENPIGKTIRTQQISFKKATERKYNIVAVMKDIPTWSTIQADFVINFLPERRNGSENNESIAFLQLEPHADIANIENHITSIYKEKYLNALGIDIKIKLQPLNEIYFNSAHLAYEDDTPRGNRLLTCLLAGIALLIVILAMSNYLTIKMAQMNGNLTGFAIQRCYGANNRNLAHQVFTEIGIHLAIAVLIAIGLTYTLHPYFIGILTPQFPYMLHLTIMDTILFCLILSVLTMAIGWGLYLFISKRLHQNGIKSSNKVIEGKFDIKKVLMVTQICIFCTLLCCSAILMKQMDYIQNKDLGFNSENIISFSFIDKELENLKTELASNPDILSVSNGDLLPSTDFLEEECSFPEKPDEKYIATIIVGDADYLSTYQIKLAEGRNIRAESYTGPKTDGIVEVMVNRKFVKKAGLTNPIGTLFEALGCNYQIVGITEDFHAGSLYSEIKPLVISYKGGLDNGFILVRHREGRYQETLAYLQELYNKYPSPYFDFFHEEYRYSDFYNKDVAFVKMIYIFTVLAIFIGGMGIFAFSLFMAESKRKEVAIRKVNGATEWQVVQKLSHNFVLQTGIACGIAIPVACFAMQKWLQGFAYKTSLDWWYFLLFTILCTGIVLSITSWQVLKAALQNPVNSIKSE